MGFARIGGGTLLAVALAAAGLSGCASMGSEGATRAATARVLGLPPGDVIIVSRSYDETGPAPDDMALANYTIKTSDGFIYTCDMQPRAGARAIEQPQAPVCKRKP